MIAAGVTLIGSTASVSGASMATARGETDLLGPLRIRDVTPFNLLRLEMYPASVTPAAPGRWSIEAGLSYSNNFIMSDNVAKYLEARGSSGPLNEADAEAILALGEDAYYVDGETALLDLTLGYRISRRSSVHLTLTGYRFSGGFMDGTIEDFHGTFDLNNAGRELVGANQFQVISSIDGVGLSSLDAPADGGMGDPVIGIRSDIPLSSPRWSLVLSGEAKLAWGGERPFLSTGSHDVGVQAALHGKFDRQGVYLSTSFVSTDGRVFGVLVPRHVVPSVTASYEVAIAKGTSMVVQLYAGESSGRGTAIPELSAPKYEASLGLRSRRGRTIYSFAVTENIKNFQNTPDIAVSLGMAWVPDAPARSGATPEASLGQESRYPSM